MLPNLGSGVILKSDLQNVNTDFSASMVRMNEEYLVQDLVAAGGGFKANEEFVDKMVREIRQSLQKQKRLVYSKHTAAELEDLINKQTTPPTDNAPSPFKLNLMRSAV